MPGIELVVEILKTVAPRLFELLLGYAEGRARLWRCDEMLGPYWREIR
jgi:hypothetical protein